MTAFVFGPTNLFITKFKIDNTDEIPARLCAAQKNWRIPRYSRVECSGKAWTVVGTEPLELREGTLRPGATSDSKPHPVPGDQDHCFVINGQQRRGPYTLDQVGAMWRIGGITADSGLVWGAIADPVPVSKLVRGSSASAANSLGTWSSGSPTFVTIIGSLLLACGVVGLAYYWLLFDRSVSVPAEASSLLAPGVGRVNNLGLMQDQENGLIVSSVGTLAGLACILLDRVVAVRR